MRNVDPLVFFWRYKGLDLREKTLKDMSQFLGKLDPVSMSITELLSGYDQALDF
jgi:hypothetical protein